MCTGKIVHGTYHHVNQYRNTIVVEVNKSSHHELSGHKTNFVRVESVQQGTVDKVGRPDYVGEML